MLEEAAKGKIEGATPPAAITQVEDKDKSSEDKKKD
jgi:hypothetical protein